jgi:hypothetical protein
VILKMEFFGVREECENFCWKLEFFYAVEPRHSAIEGTGKFSHNIEVRTISRSILKVSLLKGPKISRTKSRFVLYRGALYRGSIVFFWLNFPETLNRNFDVFFCRKAILVFFATNELLALFDKI